MLRRDDCITVGELKKILEEYDDKDHVLVVCENDASQAIPLQIYPFATTLDNQRVCLLHSLSTKGTVQFADA